MTYRKKLIEVSLPLEVINMALFCPWIAAGGS